MPTTTKTVLPVGSHTDLVITSPSIDVPANLLAFTLRMLSTEFVDPSLLCALQIDESFDAGQSWQNVAGFEATGYPGGLTRPPRLDVDLSKEQRDAALMRARWTSQGTWVYGLALDLLT